VHLSSVTPPGRKGNSEEGFLGEIQVLRAANTKLTQFYGTLQRGLVEVDP
jgi:hypothetical protein